MNGATEETTVQNDWLIIALLALAAALTFHSLFPRYEWHAEGPGSSIVVHDRWKGRFQRAAFDKDGAVQSWQVYVPF